MEFPSSQEVSSDKNFCYVLNSILSAINSKENKTCINKERITQELKQELETKGYSFKNMENPNYYLVSWD